MKGNHEWNLNNLSSGFLVSVNPKIPLLPSIISTCQFTKDNSREGIGKYEFVSAHPVNFQNFCLAYHEALICSTCAGDVNEYAMLRKKLC